MFSASVGSAEYFEREFDEAQERYLSRGSRGEIDRMVGGSLANEFELEGRIEKSEYDHLVNGRDPRDGEILVRPAPSRKKNGEVCLKHRPGWDSTLSPPKSVSMAALVGGDERIIDAHREAVREVMEEVEKLVMAKGGGDNRPEITGNCVYIQFEHGYDRPVDGFIAPQLHTHNFIMNMTRDAAGQIRAIESNDIYDAQGYLTAFYRSRMTSKLRSLGYEVRLTDDGAFEIAGFSEKFLEEFSPRSRQRDEELRRRGLNYSPKAAQAAILATREKKIDLPEDQLLAQWRARDRESVKIVGEARGRGPIVKGDIDRSETLREAFEYAVASLTERNTVVSEFKLLEKILEYQIDSISPSGAKAYVAAKIADGSLIESSPERISRGARFTTAELLRQERDFLAAVSDGKNKFTPLGTNTERVIADYEFSERSLNDGQKRALRKILANTDQFFALDGRAGTGKSTILSLVNQAAVSGGYEVCFLAPTGKAVEVLCRDGLPAKTLQSLTANPARPNDDVRRLYVVDESSQVSIREMTAFLSKLNPEDRVLLVGDPKQHEAVEAGAPFVQAMRAGIGQARLLDIVRQKNEDLRNVVRDLSAGRIETGLDKLAKMEGEPVVEIRDRWERLNRLAEDYAGDPNSTLVIAPDNATRSALNTIIQTKLRERGAIDGAIHQFTTLAPVDMKNADKKRAASYTIGHTLKYLNDSANFDRNEYARVVAKTKTTVTVERANGQRTTYNPHTLSGVAVYAEEIRELSEGDRIQFTAADKSRDVKNRDLGTIVKLSTDGITVRLDRGPSINFSYQDFRHVDFGYAITSHSSQSETVCRVLIHAQSDQAKMLVNERMTYVAVSRATHEARIYTDDFVEMREAMARSHGKSTALDIAGRPPKRCLSREDFPNIQPTEQNPRVETNLDFPGKRAVPREQTPAPQSPRIANPLISNHLVHNLASTGKLKFVDGQPRLRFKDTTDKTGEKYVSLDSRFDPRRPPTREGIHIMRFGDTPVSRLVVADSPERLLEKITTDYVDRRIFETVYAAVSAEYKLPATLLQSLQTKFSISEHHVIEVDPQHPNSLTNEIHRQAQVFRQITASRERVIEAEKQRPNPQSNEIGRQVQEPQQAITPREIEGRASVESTPPPKIGTVQSEQSPRVETDSPTPNLLTTTREQMVEPSQPPDSQLNENDRRVQEPRQTTTPREIESPVDVESPTQTGTVQGEQSARVETVTISPKSIENTPIDDAVIQYLKSNNLLQEWNDGYAVKFAISYSCRNDPRRFSKLGSPYDPNVTPITDGIFTLTGPGEVGRVMLFDSPETMLRQVSADRRDGLLGGVVYTAVNRANGLPWDFVRQVRAIHGAAKIDVVEANPEHPRSLTREIERQRLDIERPRQPSQPVRRSFGFDR